MPSEPCTGLAFASRRRALAGIVGLFAACGWPRSARAAHVVKPWPAGRPVPPLDLVDLDGKRFRLDSLAGRVAVVNFWATWCEPCRVEMPSLDSLAEKRRRDVAVVAVNYLEPAEKIKAYLQKSAPFRPRILLDGDGDATVAWTPRMFPSTVLVGRDGQPVHTVVGELDWIGDEAKALLDPLVAAPRKSAEPAYR